MIFLVFILGCCLGSFFLCQAERWGKAQSTAFSTCDTCDQSLKPRDLIPIISWSLQKGRSRCCQIPLSWAHPFVEFFCGILLITLWPLPWTTKLAVLTLFWMSLTDWYWQRVSIPALLVFTGLSLTHGTNWGSAFCFCTFTLGVTLFEQIKRKTYIGNADKWTLCTLSVWISTTQIPVFLIVTGLSLIAIHIIREKLALEGDLPFMPALFVAGLLSILF